MRIRAALVHGSLDADGVIVTVGAALPMIEAALLCHACLACYVIIVCLLSIGTQCDARKRQGCIPDRGGGGSGCRLACCYIEPPHNAQKI